MHTNIKRRKHPEASRAEHIGWCAFFEFVEVQNAFIDFQGLLCLRTVSKDVHATVSKTKKHISNLDTTSQSLGKFQTFVTVAFRSITIVNLNHCLRLLTIAPLATSGTLPHLQIINVSGCRNLNFNWDGPVNLPSLELLDASATAITFDTCYSIIRSMQKPGTTCI